MQILVNICMLTYNRIEFTKKAIQSFLDHPPDYSYEFTVVDNGSEDDTVEYLKDMYHEEIIDNLLLLDKNIGIPAGQNLAWQFVDSLYYMKFDNDVMILKDDWLAPMVEVLEVIQGIGAVAYNVEPTEYPISVLQGYKVRLKNGNLGGCFILIPKRTKDLIGYWRIFPKEYGEEDADYYLRLNQTGLRNAYMEDNHAIIHMPAHDDLYPEYSMSREEDKRINMAELSRREADYIAGKGIYFGPEPSLDDYVDFIYRG